MVATFIRSLVFQWKSYASLVRCITFFFISATLAHFWYLTLNAGETDPPAASVVTNSASHGKAAPSAGASSLAKSTETTETRSTSLTQSVQDKQPAPATQTTQTTLSKKITETAKAEEKSNQLDALPPQLYAVLAQQPWQALLHQPLASLLLAPLIMFFAWLTLRQYALHGLWKRARELHYASNQKYREEDELLPSQKELADHVYNTLQLLRTRPHVSKVYAIEGAWGSGKSIVVRAIHAKLKVSLEAKKGRIVPISINAWRDEDPDDIHKRIVERILVEPEVLTRLGWNASPISLRMLWQTRRPLNLPDRQSLLAKLVGSIKLIWNQKTPNDGELKAEMNIPVAPARLSYQEDLERLVCKLVNQDASLAITIDEIERGTPKSAQAMVVMIRRALDLRGVQVLAPYVPEIMTEMVFNPLLQEAPELVSSAHAVLATADKLPDTTIPTEPNEDGKGSYYGRMVRLANDKASVYNPLCKTEDSTPGVFHDPESFKLKQPELLIDRTRELRRSIFHDELIKGFINLPAEQKRHLQLLMREKYFGFHHVIPRITAEDLAAFVLKSTFESDDKNLLHGRQLLRYLPYVDVRGDTEQPPDDVDHDNLSQASRELWERFILKANKGGDALTLIVMYLREMIDIDFNSVRFDNMSAGKFSWRRFEPVPYLLLSALPPSAPVASEDLDTFPPDYSIYKSPATKELSRRSWLFAQLIFASLAWFSLNEAQKPSSHKAGG